MAVDPDFAKAIIQNIGLSWSKEELCDLKITVGERVFACSRFHLCTCSEFFNILLHPGSSAMKTTNFPEIRISGISPDIFALVLNAIFKGENNINADNMIELWYAANHLQINFLIQKCETFIADRLTVDNYFNFYHHALLLKSDYILDTIVGIMSSNFEQLRNSQTFLDMSAQTLLQLIKRKDFISYDNVINFIIQWVGYDEDDKEDSTCNVKDSTSVKNIDEDLHLCIKDRADKNVEVIFRNEMLYTEITAPRKRKDLLGTLMSNAQLNQVSNKGLKMLLENDLVMDNREARNAVVKALSSVMELEKPLMICSDTTIKASENITVGSLNSSVPVPVVIFLKAKNLMAYNILTNQFFMIDFIKNLEDIYIDDNKVYALIKRDINIEEHQFFAILNRLNTRLLYRGTENKSYSKYIYKDSFVYLLKTLQYKVIEIVRMKYTESVHFGVWTNVGHFKDVEYTNLISVANFKKYILAFFYYVKNNTGVYCVHYFDTNTRMSDSKVAVLGGTHCERKVPDAVVTFTFNESLFVLCGNGNLAEILEKDGFLECKSHSRLWNYYVRLYGAAVFDQTLYIFADLLKIHQTLPTACQFGSMQFIQFLKDAGLCHFMNVPQDWLKKEV